MTENEWLRATDPQPLITFVSGIRGRTQPNFLRSLFGGFGGDPADRRRDRLFLCACHRRLWEFLTEAEREFVVAYEHFAVTLADEDAVTKRWQAIWSAEHNEMVEAWTRPVLGGVDLSYQDAWWQGEEKDPGSWALDLRSRLDEDAIVGEAAAQAALLRHIFGNPFRRPTPLPHVPSTLRDLAETVYHSDQAAVGPLHDALLDAGLTELADHFTDAAEWHPKGCWAIDVLTGGRER
jgi:hypothetical protein